MKWFARPLRLSVQQLVSWFVRSLRTLSKTSVPQLKIIPMALWVSLGVMTLLGAILVHPAQALLAQITPTAPQLGDTLVVTMRSEGNGTAPKVALGSKSYPAFPMGSNQYRTLLPTTPLNVPGPLTIQVQDGSDVQTLRVNLKKRWFPTQSIWLPPGKDSNSDETEFDKVDAFKVIVSPEKYWNGPLLKPNSGPTTTPYGVRRYYNGVFAKDYFHKGVDYAGAYGSPVRATAAGRVALVGREAQKFKVHGNCVGLDHGQGVESIYLHLSRIDVKEGDFVQAGQVIGALGGSGAATGPHLHWGLYVFGQSVDPVPWRTQGFN
jgi:murein DD-endopeptidase MepM/ murein hydrolase activator NlpD